MVFYSTFPVSTFKQGAGCANLNCSLQIIELLEEFLGTFRNHFSSFFFLKKFYAHSEFVSPYFYFCKTIDRNQK